MDRKSRIVVVGAGVFGLTTACQLASEGHQNITVLDRHVPPVGQPVTIFITLLQTFRHDKTLSSNKYQVPDGSSVDISRVIRFDYADKVYLQVAYDAYQKWSQSPKYKGIFYGSPFVLTCEPASAGQAYIEKTTTALTEQRMPWTKLPDVEAVRQHHPLLTGPLQKSFYGYSNHQAGWADAQKAIAQLRDECIGLGVSFVSGRAGTVTGFDVDTTFTITAARTLAGTRVDGDTFVIAAGAWTSGLIPTYNSTLSTGQVLGYIQLTSAELEMYSKLPIYIDFSTGWFVFPPHPETGLLKMAVHGWGYTRSPGKEEQALLRPQPSTPPLRPTHQRKNFAPEDGEHRLREGLRAILPELADRPFSQVALCWYTDTPTGDFIMDYHPDYRNMFVAGGGSGQ